MTKAEKIVGEPFNRAQPWGCAFATLLLMGVAGCMSEPGDGEIVGRMGIDPINFYGYTLTPNELLYVENWDEQFKDWSRVSQVHTATTPAFTWFGYPWYPWSLSRGVTRNNWEPGRHGGKLRVRVRRAAGQPVEFLYSVIPDFGGCFLDHNSSSAEFIENCGGENSPEARIISSDYCEPHARQWTARKMEDPGSNWERWDFVQLKFREPGEGGQNRAHFQFNTLGESANITAGDQQCFSTGSAGSGDDRQRFMVCWLFDGNGIFQDTTDALSWLEGDCSNAGCNARLDYSWDYQVPYGRCDDTYGVGTMRLSDADKVKLGAFLLADADSDGIRDADDSCPGEPEDFDNYQDSDGCPEMAPQPPQCFVSPGGTACGTGAAPVGYAVTDLLYRPDCCGVNGGGCGIDINNARRLTPYGSIPSGLGCELHICTGYSAPSGWQIIDPSVSNPLVCEGVTFVARKP